MILRKRINWDFYFSSFIEENWDEPFQWGEFDCSLFIGKAYEAITGEKINMVSNLCGTYSNEEEALNLLGTKTFEEGFRKILHDHGFIKKENLNFANRGDVVFLKKPDGEIIFGLVDVDGRGVIIAGDNGLKKVSRTLITECWGID